MNFDRPHHQRIATVLGCVDSDVMREHRCYFGGGTAIALRFGEYRESVDIDFLVSDLPSFRALRGRLGGDAGLKSLLLDNQRAVEQVTPIRADQYGIRTVVAVSGGTPIKFEIVHEGRITFEAPESSDQVCGVASLQVVDLAASKLLANSDRWMDDGVFSRDIIDLAMLQAALPTLRLAMRKASAPYGEAVHTDALRAVDRLRTREGWLQRCMDTMAIQLPKAVLVQRLRRLSSQLASVQQVRPAVGS